jgi:hypothetical protein
MTAVVWQTRFYMDMNGHDCEWGSYVEGDCNAASYVTNTGANPSDGP